VNFHTLAARGGRDVPSASRPLTPPIYQTNVYVFEDMDTVESVWESKKPGFVYGRYGTGNHAMLEELVAALEGAEAAVACASGMGATTALLFGLFSPGDHLVSARDLSDQVELRDRVVADHPEHLLAGGEHPFLAEDVPQVEDIRALAGCLDTQFGRDVLVLGHGRATMSSSMWSNQAVGSSGNARRASRRVCSLSSRRHSSAQAWHGSGQGVSWRSPRHQLLAIEFVRGLE